MCQFSAGILLGKDLALIFYELVALLHAIGGGFFCERKEVSMDSHNDSIKETKVCSKCGIKKDRSEFSRDQNNKDGLSSECKQCAQEYSERDKDKKIESFEDKIVKIFKHQFRTNLITAVIGVIITLTVAGVGMYFTWRVGNYSTKEIQKALFPNNFEVRMDSYEKWYPPGRHIIKLKDRKIDLCFAVWNKSKYSAHDVFVQFFFKKEEFEDDRLKFIKKLSKNTVKDLASFSEGWQVWIDPRFMDFKESFCYYIRSVQCNQQFSSNEIPTNLKSDQAIMIVKINNVLTYIFVFIVEK